MQQRSALQVMNELARLGRISSKYCRKRGSAIRQQLYIVRRLAIAVAGLILAKIGCLYKNYKEINVCVQV